MKKFLPIFVVVFCITIFQYSYAEKFLTNWVRQGGKDIAIEDISTHNNNEWCETHSTYHCCAARCHRVHSEGETWTAPTCSHSYTVQSVPNGYKVISTETKYINNYCGNENTQSHDNVCCIITYTIAEPPDEPDIEGILEDDPDEEEDDPDEEEERCGHACTIWVNNHTHGGTDVGSKATTDDESFQSNIDTTEEYRRKNPFNIGSKFILSGIGHIVGKVSHEAATCKWTCGGYDAKYCKDCGVQLDYIECPEFGYYSDWTVNTPTFTDTYHKVNMSFVGFKVDGKSSVTFNPGVVTKTQWSRPTKNDSSFNEEYRITELIPSELKEDDGRYGDRSSGSNNNSNYTDGDAILNVLGNGVNWGISERQARKIMDLYDIYSVSYSRNIAVYLINMQLRISPASKVERFVDAVLAERNRINTGNQNGNNNNNNNNNSLEKSGLLYGTVYVTCNCSCTKDQYRIYFDLTPPDPPEGEMYTLTLVADPDIGGGVSVNGDSFSYMDTKTSPVGGSFSIYQQAKIENGYKFDAWYKADGKKYSAEESPIVYMPGYSFKLIAKFLAENRYNVLVYSDGNGTVSFNDGYEALEISANVLKGSDLDIFANPDENFTVDYWELVNSEDLRLGSDSKLTLTDIQENYVIYVHFKPIEDIGGYERLVLSRNGPGYVIGGTDYAIVGKYYPIWAFPWDNAWFMYWKEDLKDTIKDFGRCDLVKIPRDGYYLTAYFTEDPNEVYYYQLEVESDGNGLISIDSYEEEDKRLYDSLTTESGIEHIIRAYPDEGFEFDYWTDGDGRIVSGEDEYRVTITENELFIAHFKYVGLEDTFSITVESAGGGDVTGNVDDAIMGEEYPIRAYPDEGNEFLYWEDKDTGDITDYSEKDWIIMPDHDLILVAHFREIDEEIKDKYYLTLKTSGGGSASGEGYYTPDTLVNIRADADSGYAFVGWYEDNQLVSTYEVPSIRMPYYDMTLTAVFKKADEASNSPFKILSIRDIRWQDYFAGGGNISHNYLYVPSGSGVNSKTVLVNSANLIDNYFDRYRNIVYGYAVEFELVTTGIYKADSTLVITPTIYEHKTSGVLTKLDLDLGEYSEINSSNPNDVSKFMISGNEEIITVRNNPLIKEPHVTWNFVYYLPVTDLELPSGYKDLYEYIDSRISRDSNIVIKFDIEVITSSGQRFDYVKAINYLNRTDWGGNVFTYDMEKTVLDDIYDNATN